MDQLHFEHHTMFLSNYTFAALYGLLEHWFGIFHEETEPPILPSKIPWFGHLLGIMQHRTQYMLRLRYCDIIISHGCTLTIHRKRSTLPIYSLPMPAGKVFWKHGGSFKDQSSFETVGVIFALVNASLLE